MTRHETMLHAIREGMKVLDAEGGEVGTVETLHFPEGGADRTGAASLPGRTERPGLLESVAEAFRADKLPEELRQRLLMHGFLRIDSAALFAADRYVMLEDVASVKGDAVHLKLGREALRGRRL